MKRLLLPALVLAASPVRADGHIYHAAIDGRHNALVTVKRDGDRISGRILYESSGAGGLSLQGKTADSGDFEWKEMLWSRALGNTSQTGLWTGRLATDGKTGEGLWRSADGRKKLPLTLARIARIETLKDKDVDARVDYPQLDEPRFAKLNGQLESDARQELETRAHAVKSWREDMSGTGSAALDRLSAWTACDLESATPKAVSLLCVRYEYSGGAHGNTEFEARNYLLAEDGTAKPLGLWDLLRKSPANAKKLSGLIIADLRRQKASEVVKGGIKDVVDALDRGGIPFTVLPNGLAFHFAPYAAGSYAEGSFRAVIPHRALAPLYRLEKSGR
jgi:hypothetical protein